MKYSNPIIRGFNPDPSICFDGKKYYIVTSTFEFFPGVPVYESENLIQWKLIGHCLIDDIQCNLNNVHNSGGIFAPTIRYHKGVFYMVTTNVNHGGNFIVTTDDPHHTWSNPVYVDQSGIDPSLLFDEDKVYFVSTSMIDGKSTIAMCEINPLTGEKYTETISITNGSGGIYPEAPHMYKIQDYYYLMMAEGGTEYGHMETIFRSKSPYGPYELCPHNPILSHRNVQTMDIQCTGHADLFQDHREHWWMVCLGVRPAGGRLHNLGRETFLAPVKWIDGWPVVGNQGTLELEMEGPLLDPIGEVEQGFSDNFEKEILGLSWTHIRNPQMDNYMCMSSGIELIGEGIKLSDSLISPTFIGIRQTEFVTESSVEIKLCCDNLLGGISAYYNSNYFYSLNIKKEKGKLYAELEKQIHDDNYLSKRVELLDQETLRLRIVTDQVFYHFYVETDTETLDMGKGSVAGLCTEGTMVATFTGVFIGLFTVSGRAKYSNFTYKVA